MWVPSHLADTKMKIKLYHGLDENGSKVFGDIIEVKAAVFNDSSVVYTNEGEKKNLVAKAYIFESFDKLSVDMQGVCYIDGSDKEFLLFNVVRVMDFNGETNHFKLGLM